MEQHTIGINMIPLKSIDFIDIGNSEVGIYFRD